VCRRPIWPIEGSFYFSLKSTLFQDVALCSLVEVHRRFGWTSSIFLRNVGGHISDCTVFHIGSYYDLSVCLSHDFIL
jgi:hypothetical protein